HTPEQCAVESATPMRADHDEISALVGGEGDDLPGGVPDAKLNSSLEPGGPRPLDPRLDLPLRARAEFGGQVVGEASREGHAREDRVRFGEDVHEHELGP